MKDAVLLFMLFLFLNSSFEQSLIIVSNKIGAYDLCGVLFLYR